MRVFKWIILILVVVSQSMVAYGQNSIYYRQGIQLKSQDKYLAAAKNFTKHIHRNETDKDAFYHRGICHYYLGNNEVAISDLSFFIERDQSKSDAYHFRGKSYINNQQYSKSLADFQKVLDFDIANKYAFNNIGLSYAGLENFDMAINNFKQAIAIDSSFYIAYNNIGVSLYYNQYVADPSKLDLEQAIDFFDKSIELNDGYAQAYLNRGKMHYFLRDYDAALEDLWKARSLSPKNKSIHFFYGVIHSDMGNAQKAFEAFEVASSLDNTYVFPLEEMALLHRKNGNYQGAISLYKKVQSLSTSEESEMYNGLMDLKIAEVYAEMKDESKMISHLKLAKKKGIFKDRRAYKEVIYAPEFKPWKSNKKYKKFVKSVRKIKKDFLFNNYQLEWFRMRALSESNG